jgi:nucleoside-diphosphate-sugar epimerase
MLKNRYIILGSNSFLGKEIAKSLIKKKYIVVNVNKKLIDLSKKNSSKKLSNIIKKNDTIIFLAGKVPCKNLKELYYNINIAKNCANFFAANKIKNFIYFSSDAIYKDSNKKISESSDISSSSLHGLMHLIREKIFTEIFRDKLIIFRPTLVYGKNDPHNGYGPNLFIRNAINQKEIKLFGKGEELRDHIYINDLAKVCVSLILKKKYGIFNIVTGKVISFFSIAKKIKKLMPDIKITYKKRTMPMPHNGYRGLSNNKIKKIMPNFYFKNIDLAIKEIIDPKNL